MYYIENSHLSLKAISVLISDYLNHIVKITVALGYENLLSSFNFSQTIVTNLNLCHLLLVTICFKVMKISQF